jgi:hypothetical protein
MLPMTTVQRKKTYFESGQHFEECCLAPGLHGMETFQECASKGALAVWKGGASKGFLHLRWPPLSCLFGGGYGRRQFFCPSH